MGDETCYSKLHKEWRGRKSKEEQEVSGCVGWGKASRRVRSPWQGRALPAARAAKGPKAGTGRERQPGRVMGRKRPRWKTGSREEKPFKDAQLNMGFFARSREGTRMTWPGPKRWGRERRGIWQLRTEQEGDWAAESAAPTEMLLWAQHWGTDSWLQSHLCVASQGNVETRNCCFSSQFLPTSGAQVKNGDPHQEFPLTHTWVTPNTTLPYWKFNFKKPVYV